MYEYDLQQRDWPASPHPRLETWPGHSHLGRASLVVGLQLVTHHAATVVTGTTKADVLYGMRAVEDGAHLVDRTTQDVRAEDVAEAPYQAVDSRRLRT